MFSRKRTKTFEFYQAHQAALAGVLESLEDGDRIAITWLPTEALIVSDETGKLHLPAQGERTQEVTVRVAGDEISYGGEHWTAWLRSCGENQTSAIKSIRILERAHVR